MLLIAPPYAQRTLCTIVLPSPLRFDVHAPAIAVLGRVRDLQRDVAHILESLDLRRLDSLLRQPVLADEEAGRLRGVGDGVPFAVHEDLELKGILDGAVGILQLLDDIGDIEEVSELIPLLRPPGAVEHHRCIARLDRRVLLGDRVARIHILVAIVNRRAGQLGELHQLLIVGRLCALEILLAGERRDRLPLERTRSRRRDGLDRTR